MTPTYDAALAAVSSRLAPRHLEHSVRTAETAADLASRYGADVDDARLAGVLHDWSRDSSAEELLSAAARAGLTVTEADRMSPYLLHGPVAVSELREVMPDLSPDVLAAVGSHTFGAAEMSDLERILYVADMIEPARDFAGVDELREAAREEGLDELFRRAYRHTVMHLVECSRPIHPRTVEVWNAAVAEVRR